MVLNYQICVDSVDIYVSHNVVLEYLLLDNWITLKQFTTYEKLIAQNRQKFRSFSHEKARGNIKELETELQI